MVRSVRHLFGSLAIACALVACGLTIAGPQEEAVTVDPETPGDDGAAAAEATTIDGGAGPIDSAADGARDAAPDRPRDAGVDVVDASIDADGGRPDTGPPPPPYTITSSGGGWTIHDGGQRPCSVSSNTSASIVFRNQGGSTIEQWWVDFDCDEVSYGTIQPGASATRSSYATHRWRIRRVSDNAILLDFTPTNGGTYEVTIY